MTSSSLILFPLIWTVAFLLIALGTEVLESAARLFHSRRLRSLQTGKRLKAALQQ